MQECDGICGEIYPTNQLTKFPCLHALCGMCLSECSLVGQLHFQIHSTIIVYDFF